jgi:hypothetical protein
MSVRQETSDDESVIVQHGTEDVRPTTDDDAIRDLVARLSRPHRTGGRVIERASLLAEGSDFGAVIAWIEAHGGEPEAPAAKRSSGGLHSSRLTGPADPTPLRFILPAAALTTNS